MHPEPSVTHPIVPPAPEPADKAGAEPNQEDRILYYLLGKGLDFRLITEFRVRAEAAARAEEREESSRVLKVVDDSARRILLDIRVEGPEHDPCWGACKVLADDAPHEPPCERARRFCARGGSHE